jgi:hypothetical protein
MGSLLVGFGFTVGVIVVKPLTAFIHQEFNSAFGIAKWGLLGMGIGAVSTLFINKETKWHVIIPFLLGVCILVIVSFLK